MKNNPRTALFLRVTLLSLCCIVLGRVSTQFTAVASTDVAFPEWAAFVFSVLSELIVCARIVIGYAGMTHCAYHLRTEGKSPLPGITALVLALSLADYLARFVIDLAGGAISGIEIMALIWLGLQFLYEAIVIILSALIITVWQNRYASAQSVRMTARYAPVCAVRAAVLLTLLSRIALEIISIIEFVTTYVGITAAETASMIGSVIRVLVIYGGGALIFSEIFTDLFGRKPEDKA